MKAMLATRWGDPTELEYADVPPPTPAPGDVLIDVKAIGCNFPDILIVQGKYQKKPPLPFSPGVEVAGATTVTGPGAPAPVAVTVKETIGEPPVSMGADQLTVAEASPGLATTPVGAPGTVRGVTKFDGSEAAPSPASLVAVTVKV